MTTSLGKLFGTYLGIEFREDTLVFSYLKNNLSGISLVSSSTFPLRTDDNALAEIREYLRQQGSAKKVFVSIPDKWAIAKFTEIPAVRGRGKGDLANLMRFEIERHIPYNIEEVFFDFLLLNEKDKVYSIVFVAVNKEKIDYIKNFLEKLSLRLDAVVPSSFAVLNTLELSGISAGGLQEMVGIARRSRAVGKKGEANICLYIDKLNASLSVIKDGLCVQQRYFVLHTMQTFPEIISQYLTELQSRFSIERFNTLILAGDLSSVENMANELKEPLGINVISLDKVSDFSRKMQRTDINMLASSVGACFAGLGFTTYTVNMLPHKTEFETRKMIPVSTWIFLGLILVLVVGIFTTEAFKKQKYLNNIEAALENNAPMLAAVDKLSSDINVLNSQLGLLHKLKNNEITLEVLAELAGLLPNDAWVTNLEYKVFDMKDKRKGTGELIISGFASSSSTLIPILEDSPYLEKVAFVGPVKKTGDKEQFKISAEVAIPIKKDEGKEQKAEVNADDDAQIDEDQGQAVEGQAPKAETKPDGKVQKPQVKKQKVKKAK